MSIFFDIETTGLNPYTDSILTIQFKKGTELTVWKLWETPEVEILLKFLDYLKPISFDVTIYGYNCLKFDIPFLVARLNHYNLLNADVYKLIYDKKWLDLYQYKGDNYMSMDRWLDSYGIKRSCPYSGRNMPLFYENEMYQEIEEHAIDDLNMCEQFVQALEL